MRIGIEIDYGQFQFIPSQVHVIKIYVLLFSLVVSESVIVVLSVLLIKLVNIC